MRLSTLADYAVVLMSAAARHCGGASVAGKVNAPMLARETGVPMPTARKLVSRLSRAGLIESSRGVSGGVRLARPPASISLAEIVEAVDGPLAITSCTLPGNHDCRIEARCSVKPHWAIVNRTIRDAFGQVTLADLLHQPVPAAAPDPTTNQTETA